VVTTIVPGGPALVYIARLAEGTRVSTSLEMILSRIADGSLLPDGYYSELARDSALDARDPDRLFVSAWAAAHERVEEAWATSPLAARQHDLAERIRQAAFLAVSRTASQHEIASYVSDDLDLIARGVALGLSDPLLEWLWESYDRGQFPVPPLSGEPLD
jgi:hypothetical protein